MLGFLRDVDDSTYLETKQSILSGEYCPICEGDIDDEECDCYDERMVEEARMEQELVCQEQLWEERMKKMSAEDRKYWEELAKSFSFST